MTRRTAGKSGPGKWAVPVSSAIVFDLLNTGGLSVSGIPRLGLRVGLEVGFESESPLLVCIEAIREDGGGGGVSSSGRDERQLYDSGGYG